MHRGRGLADLGEHVDVALVRGRIQGDRREGVCGGLHCFCPTKQQSFRPPWGGAVEQDGPGLPVGSHQQPAEVCHGCGCSRAAARTSHNMTTSCDVPGGYA